ncbi:SH3 domain-containing protein [Iodidimonas nitroreducens]|nr:SH3 domain-containing protein [Iodidimonas nitroreducens]
MAPFKASASAFFDKASDAARNGRLWRLCARCTGRVFTALMLVAGFFSAGLDQSGPSMGPAPAMAQMIDPGERIPGASGLPLPRFVSLASDKAHMRTGPGQQYPILWTYVRRNIPLEITAEYGHWRRVRDWDGTQGWMHSALLSGNRTALVSGGLHKLYQKPEPSDHPIFEVEAGVIVSLQNCTPLWCEVGAGGRSAWIDRNALWGTYRGEALN